MHKHLMAERTIVGHPLLADLTDGWEQQGIPPKWISFIKDRLRFAYPRALWLKFNVDEVDQVNVRQEVLDDDRVGHLINQWIRRKREFKRIVFDLRGVTIVDASSVSKLLAILRQELPEHYYLCDPALKSFAPLWEGKSAPVLEEDDLFVRLRCTARKNECRVPLPRHMELASLDAALRIHAHPANLLASDVVVFDLRDVVEADFAALVMLPGIAHSLGHRNGVFTDLDRYSMRRKVKQLLQRCAPSRVVPEHMLTVPPEDLASEDREDGLRLTSFKEDELLNLQDLCHQRFNAMITKYKEWFVDVVKVARQVEQESFDFAGEAVRALRSLIKELVDNAASHSGGVGYLSMELNPAVGLNIYVGDTGIGLARGLTDAYHQEFKEDAEAVRWTLRLKEIRSKRRHHASTPILGGRGLERVGLILGRFRGEVRVRSGSAMAVFTPGKCRKTEQLYPDMYYVEGTHIHVFVPTAEL